MLSDPTRTILGRDPTHRTHAINGYAFQQDAIRTFNGWQYACFYASLPPAREPLYVHLSRRKLPDGAWETFAFEDYAQTVDDGHNTVQLGICAGDGTIHLSYDHHCDALRYRHSGAGAATSPERVAAWGPGLFTATLSSLPGLSTAAMAGLLGYVTYPRFVARGPDLLFTFRTGKAGLGDDHLCVYTASSPGTGAEAEREGEGGKVVGLGSYRFLGTHLKGVQNNPYIHGLDVSWGDGDGGGGGRLHATWVYREFVPYDGWDDPLDTKHKAQAGPNSAANNRDICHAWSADGGVRWYGSDNKGRAAVAAGGEGKEEGKEEKEKNKGVIADLTRGESILPTSPGILAFAVPRGAGLTNQEAQAVDRDGGVHVLNRDALDDDGVLRWRHYYLSPSDGEGWTRRTLAVPGVLDGDDGACGGRRGQVAAARDGDVYFVLPHGADPALVVLRASAAGRYAAYEVAWRRGGFPPGDPLVDKARLAGDNVLSVFTRAFAGPGGDVDVVVLDFLL
ncbi:hypothetical protein SAMD00023353_1000210 [Rosellinia necatrix]|uniref:Dockerin type 1 n=1 Tax=Rosellinia necatrix TaxID=77044 RepID=A0A1W2TC31_ROSNE|nr:hypothetical protein SAMD00023353_1000210 [Rosellinia necatrix]